MFSLLRQASWESMTHTAGRSHYHLSLSDASLPDLFAPEGLNPSWTQGPSLQVLQDWRPRRCCIKFTTGKSGKPRLACWQWNIDSSSWTPPIYPIALDTGKHGFTWEPVLDSWLSMVTLNVLLKEDVKLSPHLEFITLSIVKTGLWAAFYGFSGPSPGMHHSG